MISTNLCSVCGCEILTATIGVSIASFNRAAPAGKQARVECARCYLAIERLSPAEPNRLNSTRPAATTHASSMAGRLPTVSPRALVATSRPASAERVSGDLFSRDGASE